MPTSKPSLFSSHVNTIFSLDHLLRCSSLIKQHSAVRVWISDPNDLGRCLPLNYSEPFSKKKVFGTVQCYERKTMEYIKQCLSSNDVSLYLLAGGILADMKVPSVQGDIELTLTLNPNYMHHETRIPSMLWCYCLWTLSAQAERVAFTSVFFSVIGGACSSLGKTNTVYAHKAKALALRQIQLARWFKDPILECKCWLYYAEDLLQLGQWKKSERITRHQTAFATFINDPILLKMCQSVHAKNEMARGKRINSNKRQKALGTRPLSY
ncbi:hypothetical protein BDF14DRAFT_1760905 [Spinellus fusiger]|nr:hypothetical protein BDF14DRAFT_1760905 [Spinellus fusiger]